ncbi:MAG: S-layer homology domain-containing protein [Candidatus Absconditabacteria bacterium]
MKKYTYLGILVLAICVPIIAFATTNSTKELNESISWMHDNGLTQYTDATSFKATKNIRRDEAAKFFVLFTKALLSEYGKDATESGSKGNCSSFTDVDKKNTMKEYISAACNLGAIKGSSNGKFQPSNNLTNAQAVAITMRMIDITLDEPKNDRSANYYKSANQLKLLEGIPVTNKKEFITRGSLAILLYRVERFYTSLSKAFGNTGTNNTGTIENNSSSGSKTNSNAIGTCTGFVDKLTLCEKYSCTYPHPFTNENMKREILGLSGGKCIYQEQILGGSEMVCQYTEAQRKIAASYYLKLFSSTEINSHVSFGLSQSSVSSTDTINGETTSNPLQGFINDNTCTFSGLNLN